MSSVPLPKRKPLTKWQCFLKNFAQSEGNELVYIVTSFVLVNCVSHHVNKDFTLVKNIKQSLLIEIQCVTIFVPIVRRILPAIMLCRWKSCDVN